MSGKNVDRSRVLSLWVPLALSWLLMAAEQPAVSATIARLSEQKIQLAAWGSVVFPISLVVEGPIIMLLAASTALCGDREGYTRVRGFMVWMGGTLTLIHLAVALTPLYGFVTDVLLDIPPEVSGAARLPLVIMTPWTWAIAYRRFQQGVLIRFEEGRAVTEGTLARLAAVLVVLVALGQTSLPGAVVGATAISLGVCIEALFVSFRVRPVLERLQGAPPPGSAPLNRTSFAAFYAPLALTPLLTLCVQPIGSAAMGRMPREIDSLAAWGPVYALVFIPRSLGMAYNEVVVTLLGQPGAHRALKQVRNGLAFGVTAFLAILALTPLAGLWFGEVQALEADLASFARVCLLIALPMPLNQVFQSWFQGALVAARKTRAITEAVLVYLLVAVVGCTMGVQTTGEPGIYWTLGTLVTAGLCQTCWLWLRSREAMLSYRGSPT